MKDKNQINLVIYLFVAFILGGLVMYFIAINTDTINTNLGTNIGISTNGNNSACKACAETVIVNDGSLSASVEKAYDAVMMIQNYQKNTI